MILVAPTSFKGTLGAAQVARAIAEAARTCTEAEVVELPVSDGGPGLIDALWHVQDGTLEFARVTGPYGDPVDARILVQNDRAIIESADACGIHLATRRDPLHASTYGVGELLRAAAERAPHIIIGLGGSATVDGGAGMARSLGDFRTPVTALADVRNPLTGPNGAAHVFGPQKGASPEQVRQLDERLSRLAADIERVLGVDVASMEGGGAAGGLGAGLRAFAKADVVRGSDWVLRELDFDRYLARAACRCYSSRAA
jgi:glycerate kinase